MGFVIVSKGVEDARTDESSPFESSGFARYYESFTANLFFPLPLEIRRASAIAATVSPCIYRSSEARESLFPRASYNCVVVRFIRPDRVYLLTSKNWSHIENGRTKSFFPLLVIVRAARDNRTRLVLILTR